MKTEILPIKGKWLKATYKSEKELLAQYPDATLATETDAHSYYAANNFMLFLFRMTKPTPMTKKQAEKKFDIKIEG